MKKIQLTNGVSFGAKIIVEAEDLDVDGKLTVEFTGNSGNDPYYDLAIVPFATNASGTPVALTTVEVEGSTVVIDGLSATDIVYILANRAM